MVRRGAEWFAVLVMLSMIGWRLVAASDDLSTFRLVRDRLAEEPQFWLVLALLVVSVGLPVLLSAVELASAWRVHRRALREANQ